MADRDEQLVVRVEDDRTGMSPRTLKRALLDHLTFTQSKDLRSATLLDVNMALAHTVRDRLVRRWMKTQRTYQERDPKRAYYLSAEFLLGRFLGNNLINLGLYDFAERGLAEYGIELDAVLDEERDPGLGNGGLGRLAACFLDSMATLELPGYGYGIRYEFGIFRQEIADGQQIEHPDDWLEFGNAWEFARPEYAVEVQFGGHVEASEDQRGFEPRWVGGTRVLGVPFDYPIAGHGNDTVNTLRLWAARATQELDLEVFNDGDYRRAVEEKALSESISKVLYPKDETPAGKELRLKQQYFFVACSVRDILRRYKKLHSSLDELPNKAAIQLNDTHPAVAVAELMRVLVDRERLPWERAWELTQKTLAYTNHTLLPEALEKWPVELFERVLPRHLQIIYEINHRFLRQVHVRWPGDDEKKRRLSLIDEGPPRQVRMANLAVVGCHSVNGVAALHSELVKRELFPEFAELWPERFNNKTNGVTPRRWLLGCNRPLSGAIGQRIGRGFEKNLDELVKLDELADDRGFQDELWAIKQQHKAAFARAIQHELGISLDPDMLFDVQVKRIHEYKRQLMCALHAIVLYRRLRFEERDILPRAVIIGGKAAPGYARAKKHIRLINDVASVVNSDPSVAGRLACVFVPNYSVSRAERIIPAANLSEQISTAGKEASGTGNMKFQMNGALTIGTLDGANVEIREQVGAENFFLFGLTAEQAAATYAAGHDPRPHIEACEELAGALELLDSGFFSPDEPELYRDVVSYVRQHDPYLIAADFADYLACQARVERAYADRAGWMRMVVKNIAHSGTFSSDRTIRQYAKEIWNVEPVHIELEPYVDPA
ncbi:MAG: glycogen/starch/alpha-glucan phosphorylase [Myxococcales bacterium]|nr:glycogen/starch/alpha-glucan phosphorylase [Myxococcales bacterium]